MPATTRHETGRRGPATSCAECKRRKIRCRWPSATDSTATSKSGSSCSNCITRGKTCTPQRVSPDANNLNRATARDRMAALEAQVAELAAVTKTNEPETATQPTGINGNTAVLSDHDRYVWHVICAVDRFTGMTANPPSNKPGRTVLSDSSIIRDGSVYAPAYIHQLSEVCFRIHKANEFVHRLEMSIQYEEVLQNIDRDIHALSKQLPAGWWQDYEALSQTEQLIQFWHYYLLALLHLQAALSEDNSNHFAYSREKFYGAAKSGICRYLSLRSSSTESLLPTSTEVQALNVTAFLLLASHSPRGEQELDEDLRALYLTHQVMDCFKSSANQHASIFERDAIAALTRLHEFFANQDAEEAEEAALDMPLLGSISFTRATSRLGVGDKRCDSLPWSFEVDVRLPWPREYHFRWRQSHR